MTEEINWRETHPNCFYGYIKDRLYFKVYKLPDREIWMIWDRLYYGTDKTDTPCLSKEEAMREAYERAKTLNNILTKEK